MRILTMVSIFSPHTFGGAEVSSLNSVKWLRDHGHDVAVITACKDDEDEVFGTKTDGISVYRLRFPRPHTLDRHSSANRVSKVIWQLSDHFASKNKTNMDFVLQDFMPDIVFARVVPGLGYNCFDAIADKDLPTVVFIHDFNLICARSDMYRHERSCDKVCFTCRIVGGFRQAKIKRIRRLSLCAPSEFALKTTLEFASYPFTSSRAILNANKYPAPTTYRSSADHLRILYVGRLHRTKGVDTLLKAVSSIAGTNSIRLTILGEGPEEDRYRREYGGEEWCDFRGRVSQGEVTNTMVNSDILCVPSEWRENSPGVAIHAITLGLPIIGSNIGGIPEYVHDGVNGLLFPPGDWLALKDALTRVSTSPGLLEKFRNNNSKMQSKFDQDVIGGKVLALASETINANVS